MALREKGSAGTGTREERILQSRPGEVLLRPE